MSLTSTSPLWLFSLLLTDVTFVKEKLVHKILFFLSFLIIIFFFEGH